MIQEQYKSSSLIAQVWVRKSKVHLGLNMTRDVKGHKEGFYNCTNRKREADVNEEPMLNRARVLVTKDVEKLAASPGGKSGVRCILSGGAQSRESIINLHIHKSKGLVCCTQKC